MSFVEREDVIALSEQLFTELVEAVVPNKRLIAKPWPRFTYQEAMDRFGRDNPDIRFGLEIQDISDLAPGCGFQVFERAVDAGGLVRGLNAKGAGTFSRREIDELTDFVKQYGAKGLAYIAIDEQGELRSPIQKFFTDEVIDAIISRLSGEPGDLLLFVADERKIATEALGQLRLHFRDKMKLADDDVLGFCWILDFPFVVWNEDEKRWDPSHHLFTSPMPDDISLMDNDPGRARGQQYDMVLNGYEVGGGSIRIHERELQEKAFALIGLDPEVAKERFGHMLEAFEFGTPPHGGIAPGIDRICMILAGEPNIREVIAFPKNQAARDVMAGAPSIVEDKQLEELNITVIETEE
jgi:aspartyl-tRNA synthetase